jgi:hypothetical protein
MPATGEVVRRKGNGLYPEPRGPRVLPVGGLVLWYGMFAPCGRLLGTTGFARGAPSPTKHLAERG